MKKITYLLAALLLSFLMTGCVILEETRFNEDGTMSYSMQVDGSQFMQFIAAVPDADSENEIEKIDTLIVISELYDEYADSIAALPIEQQKVLQALKPFKVKMNANQAEGEYIFRLFGDFANFEAMKTAMTHIDSLRKYIPKDSTANGEMNMLPRSASPFSFGDSQMEWDGKTFRLTMQPTPDSLDTENSQATADMMMLMQGDYKRIYTFPRRVKSVSNPEATFSADGKTVTIMMKLQTMLKTPEEASVVIELEE
jgi:hypothetical protein